MNKVFWFLARDAEGKLALLSTGDVMQSDWVPRKGSALPPNRLWIKFMRGAEVVVVFGEEFSRVMEIVNVLDRFSAPLSAQYQLLIQRWVCGLFQAGFDYVNEPYKNRHTGGK